MNNLAKASAAFTFSAVCSCYAQTIHVSLEVFPPLIESENSGLSIAMLREIEKISDLKFDINIVTFTRAKHELKVGTTDMVGQSAYQFESAVFYTYAQELEWSIPTYTDIYSIEPSLLEMSNFSSSVRIGTINGNEAVMANVSGIPESNFITSSAMESLVKMLVNGRVDAIIFERASTMQEFTRQGISGVHYRNLAEIFATFSVSNNAGGDVLKEKLDQLIKKVNTTEIFQSIERYIKMPKEGQL